MIEIRYSISEMDYRNMFFTAVFRKPGMIALLVLGILNLLYDFLLRSGIAGETSADSNIHLFAGIAIVVGLPLLLYFRAGRTYRSNPQLQENIRMIFTEEEISIQGQSFEGSFPWSDVRKVRKTKSWIMIYRNRNIVQFIPATAFRTAGDFHSFSELCRKSGFPFA